MGTDRRISGDALRRPSPRRRTGESGTATSSQRVRADLLDARPDFPVPALHVGAHDAYLGIVSKFEPRRAPDPPGRNDLATSFKDLHGWLPLASDARFIRLVGLLGECRANDDGCLSPASETLPDLPIQNYNRSFPQALLHRTAGWACSSDQRADDRGPSGPALVGSSRPSFVTSARRWSRRTGRGTWPPRFAAGSSPPYLLACAAAATETEIRQVQHA
jgi:hypothetical protein